jgi:hypothetical protein
MSAFVLSAVNVSQPRTSTARAVGVEPAESRCWWCCRCSWRMYISGCLQRQMLSRASYDHECWLVGLPSISCSWLQSCMLVLQTQQQGNGGCQVLCSLVLAAGALCQQRSQGFSTTEQLHTSEQLSLGAFGQLQHQATRRWYCSQAAAEIFMQYCHSKCMLCCHKSAMRAIWRLPLAGCLAGAYLVIDVAYTDAKRILLKLMLKHRYILQICGSIQVLPYMCRMYLCFTWCGYAARPQRWSTMLTHDVST